MTLPYVMSASFKLYYMYLYSRQTHTSFECMLVIVQAPFLREFDSENFWYGNDVMNIRQGQ